MAPETTRAARRRAIDPVKTLVTALPNRIPAFELAAPLEGHNNSTQYNATLRYLSILDGEPESLEIEIGLREPILTHAEELPVQTALRHWMRGDPLLDPFLLRSLSYEETMAEKLRAALSRREVAIRDFFDIDHATLTGQLNPTDPRVLELLEQKLAIPGTPPADVSAERLEALPHQREARLRSVLREPEYARFDLERAIATVRGVARELARHP